MRSALPPPPVLPASSRPLLAFLGWLTLSLSLSGQDAAPNASATPADSALQGEYRNENVGVQVVVQSDGEYLIVVFRGGLPGAGADLATRQESDADAAGAKELIDSLQLQRVERRSPTLGAVPPTGATVLFDGAPQSLAAHWTPGAKRTDDGLLEQGCTSTDTFRDFTLHLEFQEPLQPSRRGQDRGNSGLYLQGRYEVQVLDSFGLPPQTNEAGAIYSVSAPSTPMSFPPLAWQTYDVDFTAPRWDAQGKKVTNARVTVRHNGVLVQNNVEVPGPTTAAPLPESPAPGPIHLQDHGSPVRYRNIWVLPRDAEREALRPFVAGFERFHAAATGNLADGGRLLLGELACTKCHAAGNPAAQQLLAKEPPILDKAGERLRPEWVRKFLADPHHVKPGTTMPDLLASLPPVAREETVEALVHYLSREDTPEDAPADPIAAERGKTLFHQVGCLACHAPQDGRPAPADSVPLAQLGDKYTLTSLLGFLKAPRDVRPSSRMPGWPLKEEEFRDIAAYLSIRTDAGRIPPNVTMAVYDGEWEALPDFDKLTPAGTVTATGLDLSRLQRDDHFAVRCDTYLPLDKFGVYTFHLGSDDGSRLVIDGDVVIDNDGAHGYEVESAKVKLDKGTHRVRVEYFQTWGDKKLTLEIEASKLVRRDITPMLTLTADAPGESTEDASAGAFVPDEKLVKQGRKLFGSLGCASCHTLKDRERKAAAVANAKPLQDCRPSQGCLAAEPSPQSPRYDLSPAQRRQIDAALETGFDRPLTPPQQVAHAMTAFNCYACHARQGTGGPTAERNEWFQTTIQEMGDEGRLPPALDGVGDKLRDDFLKRVLNDGGRDRPYVKTRMPRFGADHLKGWIDAVVALDRREESRPATFDEPDYRVKAKGRQLAGDHGLACVKCHSFGPYKATGIQALNLQSMAARLRDDWFLRYLVDPNRYRPGTRMPTGFPEGKAVVKDVYDGDVPRQTTAIWKYLEDAEKAGVPDGLIAQLIELKPEQRPVIYRNFIEGLTPRGIAVGYPEHTHYAWDADKMSLVLLWHGRFIDASKHWGGRSEGFQGPLGDDRVTLDEACPIAVLASPADPWPAESPKSRGYHFLGYTLDRAGEPTFAYQSADFRVQDFAKPASGDVAAGLLRRIGVTDVKPGAAVYFRAASGRSIEPASDGDYLVDGQLHVRVTGGGEPIIRESNGKRELLVPLTVEKGAAEVTQQVRW